MGSDDQEVARVAEGDVDGAVAAPEPLHLDPFGFIVGVSSRVSGLGGKTPGHDPDYVFHTPYVEAARGQAQFTVHFHDLTAKRGTLILRVNMLPDEEGATARMINSDRIQLNRLVKQGGVTTIRFEGFRGVTYALVGTIVDDTDAAASALSVTLDRPAHGTDRGKPLAEARSTEYGKNAARQVVHLVSLDRPTLANPVSQFCTPAQLGEPAYAEWAGRLRIGGVPDDMHWRQIYVMQVLHRYAMLKDGARGIGFGVDGGPLPAAIAAFGPSVVATDPPATDADANGARDELRRPAICDDARFDRHVAFQWANPAAIPDDLVNFDFLWSTGVADRIGTIADGLAFIEQSLDCLRPGALAVHAFAFSRVARTSGPATRFRQGDIEQLALTLISRGHEVAQIKTGGDDAVGDGHAHPVRRAAPAVEDTSFGIIIRKAPSSYY